MKPGSLVKIVASQTSPMTALSQAIGKTRSLGNTGKTGIVLSEYEHRTETNGRVWYTVLIEGTPRSFREDYLEMV